MTEMRIDVHDLNRAHQPDRPWTAALTVGDGVVPEQVANGPSPLAAVMGLLNVTLDLMSEDISECSDCGHVPQTEGWSQYHDEHGNCHAHRAPH